MAEVSLAQTHTDEQESGCTVICFAITHKMCASCHHGGGWVLQKNLIAKAFICQLLALKSFPAPFFSCSICVTLTGCCFMLTKKHVKSVAGEADREECVFVMFDVFAVGAVGWGGNFLQFDPCDIWPFVFKRSNRCARPHPAEFWVCGLFKC